MEWEVSDWTITHGIYGESEFDLRMSRLTLFCAVSSVTGN